MPVGPDLSLLKLFAFYLKQYWQCCQLVTESETK